MKLLALEYICKKKNKVFSLLLCALFITLSSSYAFAASWQWTKGANNRERLIISLDEPMPNIEIKRNDGFSLDISVPLEPKTLTQQGTISADSFVKSVQLNNGDFKVSMNKSGFGYIMASPANGSKIEIEFYPDPLMERFYPADGTKPAVSTTSQTSPASTTPSPSPASPAVSAQTPPVSAPTQAITPTQATASTPKTTEETAEERPAANIPDSQDPDGTNALVVAPPSVAISPLEAMLNPPANLERSPHTAGLLQSPQEASVQAVPAAPVAPVTPVAPVAETAPVIPVAPVTPVAPIVETAPAAPVAPVVETASAVPVAPVAPVVEAVPAAPVAPVTPIAETAPAIPVAPVVETAPVAPVVETAPAIPVAPVVEAVPAAPVAPVAPTPPPETIAPIINQEPAQDEVIEVPSPEEPRPEAVAEVVQDKNPPVQAPASPAQNTEPSNIFYGNSFTAPLRDIPQDSPDTYVQPTNAVQENASQLESSFLFDEAPPPIAHNSSRSMQIFAILQHSVSQNALVESSTTLNGTLLAFNGNNFIMLANDTTTQDQSENTSAIAPTAPDTNAQNPDANPPSAALGDVTAPDVSTLDGNNPFEAQTQAPPPPAEVETAEEEVYDETQPTMPMTVEEAMEQGRPVIYQDIEGNVIAEPPKPDNLLPMLEQAISQQDYDIALQHIEVLLTIRLHNDDKEHIKLKEKLLRDHAVVLYNFLRPSLDIDGQRVLDAAITAMNYNLQGEYVPELINIIVRTHIAMKNVDDAEGYILMLQEMYPQAGNLIPELLLYLANVQLNNQEYAKAVITTQRILDYFGNSPYVQEASIVQTKAFYMQGHYDRALPMITFINMRWPDSYIRFPEYLSIVADVQIAQQLYTEASETLWTEYNLNPTDPNAANLLNRLAILYYSQADFEGASKVQLELINSFPDHPEVPSALMRIAENSFQAPNPPLDTLLALFAVPSSRLPSITYQQIMDNYPNTPQAIEAHTRLAAWNYFQQEYDTAMSYAVDIMEKYPDRPQYNVALDVLLRSFSARLENALEEENVSRALDLWERYPGVQNYYLPLEDDLRVALARGYLNRGDSVNGLNHLQVYIDPIQNEKYSIYAYNLFLNQYLNQGQWQAILDLDEKVVNWNMPIDIRNQHNYTVALACENLGMSTRAIPMWQAIVNAEDVPLYQRAYANYFLARDAETKQDLRGTYQYNLDALAMFEQLAEEKSEFSDPPRIRESIAALMDVTEVAGRFAEALDWLNKYTPFVPQDSPDYAGLQLREARLYKKMGDTNKWRVVLRDIIQREPESVFGTMAASELKADQLSRDIERFVN